MQILRRQRSREYRECPVNQHDPFHVVANQEYWIADVVGQRRAIVVTIFTVLCYLFFSFFLSFFFFIAMFVTLTAGLKPNEDQ